MQRFIILIALVFLISCGGASATATAEQISTALTAAGAQNIRAEALPADSPVPNSASAHYVFEVPSVPPKGGQVFVCSTKQNCDAIYAYFDALKAIAGPYLYRSPSGTVVAQLNSGLDAIAADSFKAAIEKLP
ncbi:MAG: hypothetical protein IPP13_21995 [Kouleothrix sp.]|nr:hypothetical protein [Kouleothrix sp.]